MSGSTSKHFEFFKLIGQLKATRRTGWVEQNVNQPESIADHMYRMAILSFLVDPKDGIDKDRCIKMSLVHDMAECIVGDIAPSDGIGKEEKYSREKAAMEHIRTLLPEQIGQEMYDLWTEYEAASSKEAAFVKDLDKFDMVMQAYEYEVDDERPFFLQDFFDSTKGKFGTQQVKGWVKELNDVRDGTTNGAVFDGVTSAMVDDTSQEPQHGCKKKRKLDSP